MSFSSFLKHPLDLIASLWDMGGNIPIPAPLPSAAPSGLPVTEATTHFAPALPPGVCGWTQLEGSPAASATWVCQAFGQVMPGIVFLVCVAVVTATTFFLVGYILRSLRLFDELRKLAKSIDALKPSDGPGWTTRGVCDQVISLLAKSGRQVSPLAAGAERIRLGTLSLEGTRVVLRKPVASLVGGDGALDSWTGRSLANTLPGWLTAIGLMTTFIAILIGLQNVRVLSNLEVEGISGLINGLSGKFLSSITALGCAITVSMVNHALTRRTEALWRPLLESLEGILPHLNSEALLLELLRKTKHGSSS